MATENGRLLGIAVRPAVGADLQELDAVSIRLESGVDGDYRRGGGARQVTVLAKEAWQAACREVDAALPWTARRANLLVAGLSLEASIGKRLRVGQVLLEITGETRPCEVMEVAHAGLREALEPGWRGGVTCRVLAHGTVQIGDPVTLIDGEA